MQESGVAAAIAPPPSPSITGQRSHVWLVWVIAASICAGITVYAFTRAFIWDEGFHLVAAQMILAGKKPYIDFCFPQTPLNAYWNAAWMRVFGQSWRVSHIPAVLEIDGTMLLLAGYLLSRLPRDSWRTPCAVAGVLFFGANSTFIQFSPIAQAYAICAFGGLAAFLLILRTPDSKNLLAPFAAGLMGGVGAASSLLIGPELPVLLVWLWAKNSTGSAVAKGAAFVAGTLLPFAPAFWLFLLAPHQTFFNIVQYQAVFRRADWETATAAGHDFDVFSSWADSGEALTLGLLGLAAVLAIKRYPEWSAKFREEFWLASSIAAALIVYISTAHPTFNRYYIVGMPLFAIVAAPGLRIVGTRLISPARAVLCGAALSFLLLLCLGRTAFNERDSVTWARYQDIANAVAKVTPTSALLYADEHVYFLLHRLPPPGMEFSYSHKVDLPPKEAALLHIIPTKELKRRVQAGDFATFETCDDDKIDNWKIGDLYKQRKDIEDCSVFWEFEKNTPKSDK